MTTEDIYNHPDYLNTKYIFEGEKWNVITNYSKYSKSTCYRIRNNRTLKILKPMDKRSSVLYEVALYDNEGKPCRVTMNEIFGSFDVEKAKVEQYCDDNFGGAF